MAAKGISEGLDWRQSYEIFPRDEPGTRAPTEQVQVQPGARVTVTALPGWCGSPGPWAGLRPAGQGLKGSLIPSRAASVTYPAFQGLHLQMLIPV